MMFNKTLAASIAFIFVSPAFAGGGEDSAHQNADKEGQYSLPAVERIDEAYPASITTQERLMESVPSLDAGEVGEFFILKGEKLHTAMERWTKTAGYELVWQPNPEDGDIRFAANMVFKDTFKNAAKEFFGVVRKQTKFDAQLHSNGVLRVFVAKAN
ncbi:TcpQ domain-containing protein [Marinobacter subterrani]|uniref:TcpQ domain-containing protein n=1 Tax=Marinobacter subterrani TaxID=1658765 RepID=UPI002352E61A|nr:TcpQ domain-containing protein [Marinobacter subterrani]